MWLVAATEPAAAGDSYTLLNIVFIFAGVVVTVAGGVITALINKSAKTTPSPPPPNAASATNDPGAEVRFIVHQLQERADDCDNARDILDRRIERHGVYLELIARHLGIDLPRPRGD